MNARRALRPLRVALPFVGVLLCVGGLGVLGCRGETSAFADADVRIACYKEARNHLNATGAVELCGKLPFEMYVQIYGKDEQEAANLISPAGR